MKKYIKLVSLALCCVMVAICLTACSEQSEEQPTPTAEETYYTIVDYGRDVWEIMTDIEMARSAIMSSVQSDTIDKLNNYYDEGVESCDALINFQVPDTMLQEAQNCYVEGSEIMKECLKYQYAFAKKQLEAGHILDMVNDRDFKEADDYWFQAHDKFQEGLKIVDKLQTQYKREMKSEK